jgi:hypothetical protein
MALYRNNFSSGPDGTTITVGNSGAGDDDAFTACYKIGANTILAYDRAPDRPTAEFVMEASTGAATGQAIVDWSSLALSQIYVRMYVYFTVLPSAFNSPVIFACESTTSTQLVVAVNSAAGNEIFAEESLGTHDVVSTGGITAGRWFRLEMRFQFSTTTGNGEIRWYDDADSDTPTETLTFTNWNLGASTVTTAYFGYFVSHPNVAALRLSGLELNSTGWPGPAPFRPGKGVPGILSNPIAIHTDTW